MRMYIVLLGLCATNSWAQSSRQGSLSLEFGRIRSNPFTEVGSHSLTWQLSYMKPFGKSGNSGLFFSAGQPYSVNFPYHSVRLTQLSAGFFKTFETRIAGIKVTHRLTTGIGPEWMRARYDSEHYLHANAVRRFNGLRLNAGYDMQIWLHKNFSLDISYNFSTQIRTSPVNHYSVKSMLTPTIGFTWYFGNNRSRKPFSKISGTRAEYSAPQPAGIQNEFWKQ